MTRNETASIVRDSPSGLPAAHEFLDRTGIRPSVLEVRDRMGDISRTVAWRGNRIHLGGHRCFPRSDRVLQWWHRLSSAPDDRRASEA